VARRSAGPKPGREGTFVVTDPASLQRQGVLNEGASRRPPRASPRLRARARGRRDRRLCFLEHRLPAAWRSRLERRSAPRLDLRRNPQLGARERRWPQFDQRFRILYAPPAIRNKSPLPISRRCPEHPRLAGRQCRHEAAIPLRSGRRGHRPSRSRQAPIRRRARALRLRGQRPSRRSRL